MRKLSIILVFVFLYGCSLYSNKIEKPNIKLPSVAKETKTIKKNWWSNFHNKELLSLIKEGVKNNSDLLIAVEKIRQIKAEYGITKSQLFPSIEASFNASRSKALGNLPNVPNPSNDFNFNGKISFNIDIFNKLNNARKAQLYKLLAQKDYADEVRLNLVSNIASIYFDLCINRNIVQTYKNIVKNDAKIVKILEKQYKFGLIAISDIKNAKINLLTDKNDLKLYTEKIKSDKFNLAFLVGKQPSNMSKIHISCNSKIKPVTVPPFMPSQIIKKRPDIQEALNNLKAASFNLKSIKAELFPSITLTAEGGYESNQLRKLVMPSTQFWNILLNALVPILEFGRISNRIKEESSIKKQAVLNYVNTIKNAFKEIYIDLNRIDILRNQYKNVLKIRYNSCNLYNTTYKEYINGIKNIIDVTNKSNLCLRSRIGLLKVKLDYLKAEVMLYKDLGGGW